jgi:hypothetical protein
MAEQKTAQQVAREQYKVAENVAENSLRAWNDFAAATTEYGFDVIEKSFRYNQEAVASYRKLYLESVRTWQGYAQGVSQIFSRSN